MRYGYLFGCLLIFGLLTLAVFGQQTVVINDPMERENHVKPPTLTDKIIKEQILPKVRKHWTGETCTEEFESTGLIRGAFTKPNSRQTLFFFQFCQTGNGMGNNGLILLENDKIVGNYISEGGWALNIKKLPDINKNGLDEFALYYSGGMHQGQGGIGVDVWELSGATLKGLGWFQANDFNDHRNTSFKVSVKPGKVPAFYREKYESIEDTKLKKIGKIAPLKLKSIACKFTALK